jgi:hypothetical protein
VRFRNTAILAAIVVLVGAYLYFVERPAVEREAEKKTLVAFAPEDATGIVLEYPDRTIELAEREGAWVIVKPRELEADQTAVKSLLRATAEAELKRVVEEKPGDVAKFGLSPPAATIRIRLGEGKSVPALAVGDSTPIGFNAYVRRGDEPAVLLTSGTFQSGVKKDLEDLRDRTVVRFEDAEVQKVTFRPAGQPATAVERAGEGWRIAEPIQAKADPTAVQGVLASLRAMRARGFVDAPEDEAGSDAKAAAVDRGLDPPRLAIEVAVEGGEPQVVELGAEKEGEGEALLPVRVAGRATIYEVGAHTFASLAKTANDLRDKTVLEVEPAAVASLEVARRDGEGFTLERQGEGWIVAGAGDAETRDAVASRLVEDATGLKGSEVISEPADPAAVGLDEAPLAITLRSADATLGKILLSSDGERHYVVREGGPVVYGLPDYVYRRFDKRRSDFLYEPAAAPPGAPRGGAAPGTEGPGGEGSRPTAE